MHLIPNGHHPIIRSSLETMVNTVLLIKPDREQQVPSIKQVFTHWEKKVVSIRPMT